MNIINKFLILIIICLLISYLTKKNIFTILNKYFCICRNKIEGFLGLTYTNKNGVFYNHPVILYDNQRDFPYLNNNENNDSYNLYRFINSLITSNVNHNELTSSNKSKIPADVNMVNDIMKQLNILLNKDGYNFTNIKLLDDIYYHENPRGKELEIFNISADVYFKQKPIGTIILNLETFLRHDMYSQSSKYGVLTIIGSKLLDKKNLNTKMYEPFGNSSQNNMQQVLDTNVSYSVKSDKLSSETYLNVPKKEPSNIEKKAIKKAREMNSIMDNAFNNHFVGREQCDDLFIKTNKVKTTEINDTDNSLIPTIIDI